MDTKIYTGLLLTIGGVVFGVLLATSGDDPDATRSDSADDSGDAALEQPRSDRDGTFPAEMASADQRTADRRPDVRTGGNLSGADRRARKPDEATREVAVVRRPVDDSPNTPAEAPATEPDMGGDAGPRSWTDPVNRDVLGDKRWMAPVSAQEQARIDEIFERSRELRQEPGLTRLDRLTAIESARIVVDACYDALQERRPGMQGRLIVRWTSGADEDGGWASGAEIPVNHKLQDPEFSACVIDGVNRMSFPAEPAEAVLIEYPFFYDGSF